VIDERSKGANVGDVSSDRRQITAPGLPRMLMYHAIAEGVDDPNRICVSPRRFEAQMRFLKRSGLRGVCVRELLLAAGKEHAKGLVGLTFDDGYENFLYVAVPILRKYGFYATVFAVGGMLGAENAWDEGPRMKLLGAEGLREAARLGMEVGSHGMSHIGLSGSRAEELGKEVVESRQMLGEILGEAIEGFCYPYGSVDGATTRAARQAGYSYACACWRRVEGTVYDLPRPPVWELDGSLMLKAKLGLFPLYFEMTGLPVQNAVDKAGRLIHGKAKHAVRRLSTK
jgi:peptidoglycan/xylan/chitin deacetylase (PgdA/CDA1 family)